MYLPAGPSEELGTGAEDRASGAPGQFTFVLHSHLPYVRENGIWPHGEEWLYEALAETYLPLLDVLSDLAAEGIRGGVTVGLTPILTEQLADPLVLQRFEAYLADRTGRAERDLARFRSDRTDGDAGRAALAAWYRDWYAGTARAFSERYGGDVVGAFRRLQDEGVVEIATSAATHGYLPLLATDAAIRAQVHEGVRSYERFFGRRPRAIWLPECAYRPAVPSGPPHSPERQRGEAGDTRLRPGLEHWLEVEGLELFFTETQLLEGGPATSATRGELIGPYGAVRRRRGAPRPPDTPSRPATTYEPYFVRDSSVAVIGRNERTSLQVWSGTVGYPGDFAYREFHRRDEHSGLQYWRITGRGVDLGAKTLYDPQAAAARAHEHAQHFCGLVHDLLEERRETGPQPPLVAAAYDTELFGHWWFEGVAWLGEVIRCLDRDETVQLTTAAGRLDSDPPTHAVELPEGSWGMGGTHFTWWNADTEWFWPIIHACEERVAAVVERELPEGTALGSVDPGRLAHLRQVCREALLLQASDWPFLVTTGQAAEYAEERFREHVRRFEVVCEDLERTPGALPPDAIARRSAWEERDGPFPDLDPRSFARLPDDP